MRVLILGIDALDYDLVEEWDLKNIKQQEYGKVHVPITKGLEEPATEIVWPCFITGKQPQEMGFTSPILYRHPYKWFFHHFYAPFTNSFHDIHPENILETKTFKRRLLDKLSAIMTKAGIFYHPTRKNIKAPTLFENPHIKTTHFHIPVYDPDAFPEYRKTIVDVITKKTPPQNYIKTCKNDIQYHCNELETYLNTNPDWQLIMMYWFTLDAIQHAFYNNKITIMNFYLHFNQYINQLTQKIPKDTLLLIISDHGQKKGIHTPYGFYSTNKKIALKNPDITDFKNIIEHHLTIKKKGDKP